MLRRSWIIRLISTLQGQSRSQAIALDKGIRLRYECERDRIRSYRNLTFPNYNVPIGNTEDVGVNFFWRAGIAVDTIIENHITYGLFKRLSLT